MHPRARARSRVFCRAIQFQIITVSTPMLQTGTPVKPRNSYHNHSRNHSSNRRNGILLNYLNQLLQNLMTRKSKTHTKSSKRQYQEEQSHPPKHKHSHPTTPYHHLNKEQSTLSVYQTTHYGPSTAPSPWTVHAKWNQTMHATKPSHHPSQTHYHSNKLPIMPITIFTPVVPSDTTRVFLK